MWADTLLLAERGYLVQLALWALVSVVAGTAVLAGLAWRRVRSPLLAGFAVQQVGWGALALARAGLGLHGLVMRDLTAATRLDHYSWLGAGLDIGLVAVGVTTAVTAWIVSDGRRLRGVGAGLGIILQGAALLVIDARFLVQLAKLV